MTSSSKKLVLFDIDGTLVNSSPVSVGHWKKRLNVVFEQIYNTPLSFEIEGQKYNGRVDKQILWMIAQELGIPRAIFDQKYLLAKDVLHKELQRVLQTEDDMYVAISEAKCFAEILAKDSRVSIGLLTGNIEQNAWVKIHQAGLDDIFTFGAFSDDVESREELVEHAIAKAHSHFGVPFSREDIFVVGDTAHDIRAAKARGVRSIGVSTGASATYDHLVAEKADLVVGSLMDERVLQLLGLD